MTKIGTERSHMARHSFTISRVLFQRPDRKGVPKIVYAATAKSRAGP